MQIITKPIQFRRVPAPVVMAAGFFDGIHKGHQAVLSSTLERARQIGGHAWVLTFDKHPLQVLAPSKSPPLLTTLEQRLAQFEAAGMDGTLLLPFTRRLAILEPETFVRWLCGKPKTISSADKGRLPTCFLKEIRCGDNWRFGRKASGTPQSLQEYGKLYGFKVIIVPYAEYHGKEISSTRIRQAVQAGAMQDAAAMLGRAYSLEGKIIRGRGVGRTLGFATANMLPVAAVLPPYGVYAVKTTFNQQTYHGVASYGTRPTFATTTPEPPLFETHLLDFSDKLYGKSLTIELLARLRSEEKFVSQHALIKQIKLDIEDAGKWF